MKKLVITSFSVFVFINSYCQTENIEKEIRYVEEKRVSALRTNLKHSLALRSQKRPSMQLYYKIQILNKFIIIVFLKVPGTIHLSSSG